MKFSKLKINFDLFLRNDYEVDSDENSNDSYNRRTRSRSPQIIRKPVDARSFIKMKNNSKSRSDHSSKNDLRDKLRKKY